MNIVGAGPVSTQRNDIERSFKVLGTGKDPFGQAPIRIQQQEQKRADISMSLPDILRVARISDERSSPSFMIDEKAFRSSMLKYQRLLANTSGTEEDTARLEYAIWMSDRAGVSVEHAFYHAEDVQKRLFDFSDNISVYNGWKYFQEAMKKANWEEGLQDRLNARFEGVYHSDLTDEEKETEYEKIRQEYVDAMNKFPSFKHAESWVPTSWIDGIASTIPYMTKIGTAAAAGALVLGGAAAIIGSGGAATPIVAAAIPSVAAMAGFGAAAGGFIMSKQLIQNQHTISRMLWEDENGNHLDPRVVYWSGQLSSAIGAAAETYLAGAVLKSIGKFVLPNAVETVISTSLWKRAGKGALLYLKGVGTESFEEGFQKVTEDVTDNLAKWLDSRLHGTNWDYVGFKDILKNAAGDFLQSVPTMMALGFLPFAGATAASLATAGIDKRSDARVWFDTSTGETVSTARIINQVSDYDKETVGKRLKTARTSRQKLSPIKVVDAGTDISGQQLYRVVKDGDIYQGLYEQGVRSMQIEEMKRSEVIGFVTEANQERFARSVNDLAVRVGGKIDVSGPTAYIIANDPTKNAALDPDSVISISDNTSIPDKRGVYGTELELDVAGEAGKVLVVTEGTWATDKLLGTQVQEAIDEISEDGTNTKPLQSVMRAIFRETRGMDAQQATDHMNKNAPRILRQLDKLSPEEAALPAIQQLRKTLESGLDASTLKSVDAVASEQAAKKAPYEMTPEEYAEQAEQMDEQDQLSEERKQKVRIERAREQWEQQRQEDATEKQKDHAEKLQRRVDEIDEQVGTKTTVVPRAADLPANVAETAIQNGLPPSDVRAVFHNGDVFINAEQSTLATIEATWAHEWTAHRGLRALFGDAFVSEMEKLFDRIGEKVINAALPDYLQGKDKATRAEEYLAQKAERLQEGGTITSQEMGFIDKVVDLIRRFLRKIGIKVAMSDAEIRRLLSRANDALQNSVTDIDGNMVPTDAEGNVLFQSFVRRTETKNGMSRSGYAMMVRAEEADTVHHYGPNIFTYNGQDAVFITDIAEDIIQAFERTKEQDDLSYTEYGDLSAYEELSGEEFVEQFNPDDIVNTAEAWDDESLVYWLYSEVLEPAGIRAIETYNGAIVFDETLLQRVEDTTLLQLAPPTESEAFRPALEIDTDLISEMPENKVLDTQEKISAHNAIVEAKQILLDAGMLTDDVLYDFADAERDLIDGEEVTNTVAEYLEKAGEKRTIEEIYKDHEYDDDPDMFSPDMDLFEWAIQAKGITDDINEAGYVLPDGTMLDFSGKRDGAPGGERIEDHRQLNIPIKGDLSGSKLMIAFQRMGAMRIDANTGLVDLEVMPSWEQLKVIKDLIEMNEETFIDLQDGDRRAAITSMSSPDKVIGQIRRFYSGAGIASSTLFQVYRDPYHPYLHWKPETTADGKMKGAPGWLQNDADFGGLLRLFRKLVKEGVSGRYWYEESAREVWRIADGDPVKAEKFIMLLAIYSPRNSVPINTVMAIRAFSHWMAGLPEDELHSGMTMLDDKAKEVLYHDTPWEGRKTESFYINLMHELVKMYPDAFPDLSLSDVGTMDMWMARAFGYDVEAYPNDKGSGKYSFSENTLKRIAAELNAKLKPGGEMWTTHQVQAAIWSAIKTRYELKSVIDSANEESIKKGYSRVDGKGNIINPKTGDNSERGIAHREIYRRHALTKAGTSDEVKKLTDELGFSFRETLVDSTHVVTWEAIPSPKLGYEILDASPAVQEDFTRTAMSLIIDADGSDRLAKLLGVPMHFAKQSQGGYENAVSPNVISSLVPPRMIKEEANFNKVRLYAGAIQYIFKQNAVPFFKFRSKPIVSEADKGELKYRVVTYKRDANNEIVKTTTVPRSTMNTQAEAEAFLENYAAKHPELVKDGDYPTIAVHGGKFSMAAIIAFEKPLDHDTMVSVLSGLSDLLGGVGFTKIAPDKMAITNYRDGTTGAPWTHDEVFKDAITTFIEDNASKFGIIDNGYTWTEGEYGYDHSEEWSKDKEGSRILDARDISGRPDLKEWVVRRGDYFRYLIKRFSGKNLKRLEKLYNQKVEVPRELYTDRFQVVNTYHGTAASFDRFDPDYIGSGERSQVFGWGFYLTNNREIAESYRQRQIAEKYPQEEGPQPYGNVYKVSLDESLRFVDFHLPFDRQDYDRIIKALADIDDDFLNDMIEELDPGMTAGSVYRTISGGIAADYDDLRGTSEFLDELGINGFRYQSGTINGIPEEGSYNYVVFNPDNAVIEGSDIRFATVPEKYRQRHRQQVQAAMKRGITVPDRVLQAYAEEKWASDELNDRKLLRSFSWLMGLAKNVHSPEELRELANEELGKQGFDVLSVNTPEDLAFYERIMALAASETRGAYVSRFMDIVNSDRQLRAMISEIADAREDYHGLGLPRFMWDLVAKVDAGSQVTDADLDMIRSYVVRNREKMAQAYYAGKGDLVALAQFGSDEVLYGDEAPAERALNASLVKDPEVRQQMLDGTISYARLVDYENQLQQEMAQLEGETDSLQRTIDGLNREILEQKEQQKETVSKLREFYRERTDRIVNELREKQQERDEVRKEREYVEKLAARMRRPVPSQTTSYAVGRKMNAVAELIIPKRWYRMEGTPLGRKRVPADKERASALLEYLANPDQGVNEFLDAINEFRELTLGDFTTDQIRLLYSLTEGIREQGRREMEAFLDAQRERRNEAIGTILKEVLRGEKQKVFENIGSIETSEEQASGPAFHVQAMSLRPPRMILLMSGGKEGVMYDWYINKINAATDEEIRQYQRRMKAGQQAMKDLGITVRMLEKELAYNGVTMRTDDVLHLWIAMMNEKSAAAVIYGNRISREVISGLTSQLSPGMKKWGYYMLKDFEDNYKRLNDTFIADRNMDMGKEAYYFPMIRQDLDQMPLGDEFASQIAVRNAWRKGYAEKKFTIDRLDIADEHQKPIRLGATQIWFEQVNKQEHYISSALLAKDLQYIADNQVLRDALKQKYGRRANSWLRKYVNDWANPTMYKSFDAVSRWMGVVRNNMAVAYLGFNLLTVLKQAPSLAFYFRAANPLNMLKAASEMVLHPLETMRFVEQMDPQVAARSYDRLTEELKAYDPNKVVRGMKAIGRVSMKPIMWMDKAAVTLGWMAVYHNAKSKGMSDLEAAREAQKATLDSQPAGRPKDVAEMYRSNELANWFTMFSNQLNQIWNMYAFDIPNAIKQHEFAKLIGILAGIGVSGLAIAYLSGWRMPDEPEDLPKEAARELFLNFLSIVPFMGNGLKSGYDKQFFGVGVEPFPIAYTAGKLFTDIQGDPEKIGPDIVSLLEDFAILTGLPATGARRLINVGRYKNLNELLGYGFTQYTRK